MGWTLVALGNGYSRIDGVVYPAYVVATDEVCDAEKDEYLRLFSRLRAQQGEATRWLSQWMAERKMKQPEIEGQPDYEAMFQKMVEALPAERRLAGWLPRSGWRGWLPSSGRLPFPSRCFDCCPKSTWRRFLRRCRRRFEDAYSKHPTEPIAQP